jgi:glycosyltransferase involved in cell wall biosynthesis
MRLLYVIDSLDESGGAQQALASLAGYYREAGIMLEVVYLRNRAALAPVLREAGAAVTYMGRRNRAQQAYELARFMRSRKYDLVHTTLFEADITARPAARAVGVPVVSSLVNVMYGVDQARDPRIRVSRLFAARAVDAMTCRSVDRFHAISRDVADVMSRRLRIPRRDIEVIPRGRESALLGKRTVARRVAVRRSLGIDADTPVVLAAARQEYQKGLDILIDAVPQLLRSQPDVHVLIAGRDGGLTPDLIAAIHRYGIARRVTLLGSRSDVPDLMSAADVFVLPSRWEGLGSVLLEAMALETPIIASDLPCVREVFADETSGILVRPGDVGQLVKAIHGSIVERDSANTRAAAARRTFSERYELCAVAARMVAFYKRVLARRGKPVITVPTSVANSR